MGRSSCDVEPVGPFARKASASGKRWRFARSLRRSKRTVIPMRGSTAAIAQAFRRPGSHPGEAMPNRPNGLEASRRPSRRGVDRNNCSVVGCLSGEVAPRAGAWIETANNSPPRTRNSRRPSRRGVDRNMDNARASISATRSPLAQGRGSKQQQNNINSGLEASPLAQGRGSKRSCSFFTPLKPVAPRAGAWIETSPLSVNPPALAVAPRAGAWIETASNTGNSACKFSRPSRRGVDRNSSQASQAPRTQVAPRAGAWIETATPCRRFRWRPVAPRAGAWIETISNACANLPQRSRPSRRGVDRNHDPAIGSELTGASPLAQGRGSKLIALMAASSWRSRPSRRGVDRNLKGDPRCSSERVSPLAQGRGSKPGARFCTERNSAVAPRAGAWIETLSRQRH